MNRSSTIRLADITFAGILLLFIAAVTAHLSSAVANIAPRVRCASNLVQIGKGLNLYLNDYHAWPRTRADAAYPLTQFTHASAPDPFLAAGPDPNDITAAYFLLCKTEDLNPEVFLCPDSGKAHLPPNSGNSLCNFPSEDNLDFSFAPPYADATAAAAGYALSAATASGFAIAADMNSGNPALLTLSPKSPAAQLTAGNSMNHRKVGQNVLYNDGHVAFDTTPLVGIHGDNIYTRGGAAQSLTGFPAGPDDSFLLPIATKPPPGPLAQANTTRRNTIIALLAVGAVVFAVLFIRIFRSAHPRP